MKNVKYSFDIRDEFNDFPFKRVTLGKKDKTEVGLFPNKNIKKVSTILKKFGKEGVIRLLHYYDLDDEILKEYHLHIKKTEDVLDEQKSVVQERTTVSVPMEETYVTTSTEDLDEDFQEQDACVEYEPLVYSVLYDPEDDPEEWKTPPYGVQRNGKDSSDNTYEYEY